MAIYQERCRANVRNWRAKTDDAKLRRFYESLDCARLFNTRYLLDYTGVNLKGPRGRLAISIVCNIGDEKKKSRKILFDWLIREKCDFNFQDDEGLTLINWLCKNNRTELFEFLVNKCLMDIDYVKTDDNGDAPLTHAVRMGNLELVQSLIKIHLQFGLSVDLQNREGISPYAEAVKLNFPEIADLLKTEGKASTNVFLEPLWFSLPTFKHCFKEVLSISQKTKGSGTDDKSSGKNLRSIKKKATRCSKNSRRRKSSSKQNDLIEPTPTTTTTPSQRSTDTLEKISLKDDQKKIVKQSRELQNSATTSTTAKLKSTNSPDTPIGSHIRKTGLKQQKPLCKKSVVINLRISGAASPTPPDGAEARVMAEEYRMNELMQYRSQPRNPNQKITYDDVWNFYPTMQRVGSASNTTEQLRWLLRLQMDQRKIEPASPTIQHLDTNEVGRLIPDRVKHRKFAIIPLISQEKTEMLCNAVFKKILNSHM